MFVTEINFGTPGSVRLTVVSYDERLGYFDGGVESEYFVIV